MLELYKQIYKIEELEIIIKRGFNVKHKKPAQKLQNVRSKKKKNLHRCEVFQLKLVFLLMI